MERFAQRVWMLFVLAVSLNTATAAEASKPNIIFILCDDLGYGDLGVFYQNARAALKDRGRPAHFTPNLDRFAAEGLQLPQHYCPAPVCAPSRASFLLGVHQGHANVRDNQFDKALEDNHTVASVLRQAGYTTAAIGKWGLQGTVGTPPNWPAHPLARGFDSYFGYIRHSDGHEHYPKEGLYRQPKEVWENRTEVSSQLDKCYTADLFTARAKRFLSEQQRTNSGKPFFLYLAYDTPHATTELPTQEYPAGGGLKGGLQWLGEAGHMITTASGRADSWMHPDYANATWDHDHDAATPEKPWPDVYKRYATAVRRIDDGVGDILQHLKDLGLDEKTLVVFTSDNGPSKESYLAENLEADFFDSFGPFDGIKRDCWEGGIRVGALARWPGRIPARRSSPVACSSYDWLPTFAELAGLPVPARMDGVSLVPTLTGSGSQKAPRVYVEYFEGGRTPAYADFLPSHRNRVRRQMQFVRVGDLVGVRYNILSHATSFEIYDIAADPKEERNLASGRPEMEQTMKDLVLRLRRPGGGVQRPYDGELIPGITSGSTEPGVEWSSFAGHFPWVPELTVLDPAARGRGVRPDAGLGKAGAVLFKGFLEIPSDGAYTFYLSADTGAFLRVHEAQVLDADKGYAAGSTISGSILLKAGRHPFRLYARMGETPAMSWEWSGPGFARQAIPDQAFSRPIQGTGK